MWNQLRKMATMRMVKLDEGTPGWKAGRHDVTREDRGTISVKILRDTNRVKDLVRTKENMSHTEESFQELLNKIKLEGYDQSRPVTVAVEQDGTISIIDGTHRLWIAEMIGIEEVPAIVRYFGNSQKNTENILE